MIRSVFEWQLETKDVEILVENFAGFLYFQGSLSKYYTSVHLEKKVNLRFPRQHNQHVFSYHLWVLVATTL